MTAPMAATTDATAGEAQLVVDDIHTYYGTDPRPSRRVDRGRKG